ncbi:adenine nucleotide alpha hydrolase family protein [Endothiovibrio diazotrophicus]
MLTTLSLGYGVQSSTIALLAMHGEIERPDYAIFADTHAEPESVYRWREWLDQRLDFYVQTVSAGDLKLELQRAIQGEDDAYGRPPLFVPGRDGGIGRIRRQCTGDYKIDPIRKEQRRLAGLAPGQRSPSTPVVEQWIGISTDEIQRAKLPRERWLTARFPLLELKWSRADCLAWLKSKGYPRPPRSACTFCPNRSDDEWASLRDNDPADWQDTVDIDHQLHQGVKGLHSIASLHRTMQPLDKVILTPKDAGIGSLWDDECGGVCGL